jgi:hypothetical protein
MTIHLNTLTTDQVCEVLELAERKASKADWERITKPGNLLAPDGPAPELQQLVTAIDRLPPSAKDELMTLVWLGMGTIDDDPRSWTDLLHAAHEGQINDIPEELALLPNLTECLHRGLERVG